MKRFSFFSSSSGLLLSCLTLLSGCGGGDQATETVAQAPAQAAAPAAGGRGGPAGPAGPMMDGNKSGEDDEESGGATYGGESTGGSSYGSESNSMTGSGGGKGGMAPPAGAGGMGPPPGMSMGMGPPPGAGMGPPPGMGMGKGGDGESVMMGSGYQSGDMQNNEESGGMGSGYDPRSMASNVSGGKGAGMSMGMPAGYAEMMGGGMGGPTGGMMGAGGSPGFAQVSQFIRQNCINCHGSSAPKGNVNLASISGDVAEDAGLWEEVISQLESSTMPPENVQQRPNPQQQTAVVDFLRAELTKAGMGEGSDYLVRAKHAFASGKEAQAIEYFYAQALTASDEDAQELLKNARWFAKGKRPVTTLRFAVGVILDAPEGLDVKPIGTSQMGNGGAGGAGGRPSMGGYEGGAPGGANTAAKPAFYDLTGDFGQALASAFQTRWSSGALGTVFSDVVAVERKPAANGMGMGMMGMGMGEEGRGMGMGRPGMGGGPGGPGGPGGETATASTSRKVIHAGDTITPGLVYLGTGSQQDLLAKATEVGVDGLFIYDVEAAQNRRVGVVNNATRLRLMLTDGIPISMTKTLKNTDIERAKMRGEDSDDVQKNIDQLFAKFDDEIKLIDMPTPKPEHAKGRLQQLVNAPDNNKLVTLFETRLYHALGALTQEEVETVYQIVLRGNEGVSLASGTPEDRKLVMEEVVLN